MYSICIEELFFEGDTDKDKENIKKHGICFDLAKTVFYDENRIELFDEKHSNRGEERYITIGMIKEETKLILLVYTVRKNNIRIISARAAGAGKRRRISMATTKKRFNPEEKITEEQKKMIRDMDDREIEFSDIPELTDEQLRQFKRVNKPLTRKVTINLNENVIVYFKEQANATGIPYQTLINLYLTDCANKKKKPEMTWK